MWEMLTWHSDVPAERAVSPVDFMITLLLNPLWVEQVWNCVVPCRTGLIGSSVSDSAVSRQHFSLNHERFYDVQVFFVWVKWLHFWLMNDIELWFEVCHFTGPLFVWQSLKWDFLCAKWCYKIHNLLLQWQQHYEKHEYHFCRTWFLRTLLCRL